MRRLIEAFRLSLKKVNEIFAILAGVATLTIMCIGSIDIITTNVFAMPVPAAFEFIETLLVIVVFFSISLAQSHKAHIRVEVVYNFMSKDMKFISDLIGFFLNSVIYGLIAYYGLKAGIRSFDQGAIAAGIISFPLWPTRFALFIGSSLMTIQCVTDFLVHLFRYQEPKQKTQEPKPWI